MTFYDQQIRACSLVRKFLDPANGNDLQFMRDIAQW